MHWPNAPDARVVHKIMDVQEFKLSKSLRSPSPFEAESAREKV
jgi:hypothetical protein